MTDVQQLSTITPDKCHHGQKTAQHDLPSTWKGGVGVCRCCLSSIALFDSAWPDDLCRHCGRSVVYKYATSIHTDFDDEAMNQLWLAHCFYNGLVEIWRAWADKKEPVWRQYPKVDACWKTVEDLYVKSQQAFDAWKKSKIITKDRKGDPELYTHSKAVDQELAHAYGELKKAKNNVRAEHPELQETWKFLKTEMYASAADLRREYSVERGLYWGTYNRTYAYWDRAQKAVTARWEKGLPAKLQFRRWDGTGQISVQIQRQATDPPRDIDLLSSGKGRYAGLVSFPKPQDDKYWGSITLRTGGDRNNPVHSTFDEVRFHRPIPKEGEIADVVVSRRQAGSKFRVSVEATVKLPDVASSTAPGVCAVDIGWRVLDDGSIRVAVWRGKNNAAIEVPHHFQERRATWGEFKGQLVTPAIIIDGEGGEVRIPHYYVQVWNRVADFRSKRDTALESLREELIKRWPQIHIPHSEEDQKLERLANVTIGDLKRWRSPARFKWLSRMFNQYDLPFADELDRWNKADNLLWDKEWQYREKVINWRSDLFRNVAALLADRNSTIYVEEAFVAKVKRKGDEPTHAEDATRVPSVIAAPASLITAIANGASGKGVQVERVKATNTTLTHLSCGHVNKPGAGKSDIWIKCAGCNETYDQDRNACWVQLRQAGVA